MIQMSICINKQLRLVQRDTPFGMGGRLVREQCSLGHYSVSVLRDWFQYSRGYPNPGMLKSLI